MLNLKEKYEKVRSILSNKTIEVQAEDPMVKVKRMTMEKRVKDKELELAKRDLPNTVATQRVQDFKPQEWVKGILNGTINPDEVVQRKEGKLTPESRGKLLKIAGMPPKGEQMSPNTMANISSALAMPQKETLLLPEDKRTKVIIPNSISDTPDEYTQYYYRSLNDNELKQKDVYFKGTNYDPLDPEQTQAHSVGGATGIKMRDGMVAVSRRIGPISDAQIAEDPTLPDRVPVLPYGTIIEIPSLGKRFMVADTMNGRYNQEDHPGIYKIDFPIEGAKKKVIPEYNKDMQFKVIEWGQGIQDAIQKAKNLEEILNK